MLCKRTMRAALAPVIGLFGVLVAFTAGADVELGDPERPMGTPANQFNQPQRYAAETLSKTGCFKVGSRCHAYRIVASSQTIQLDGSTAQGANPSQMEISAVTDTLLPTDVYFVRYEFSGALITTDLVAADLEVFPIAGDPPTLPPTGTASNSVADGGRRGDNMVIFELADTAARYGRGSKLTLDLSGTQTFDEAATTTVDETTPGYAKIGVTGPGDVRATVTVHASLADAIGETGALVNESGLIAKVDRVVSAKIDTMYDIADVSTTVDDGGPFRRFVATGEGRMGGKDSGVLGKTTSSVNKAAGHRNANTGAVVADSIVASLSASVTSEAGNFAVATIDGGVIHKTDDFAANRMPWMLAKEAECKSGPLTLGVVGGTIETYQRKACPAGSPATCDGDPDGPTGPRVKGDLTPAGIASANIARGTAGQPLGVNYFCVLVAGNTDPIPEIGDPDSPASYNLTVTPILADDDPVVKPVPVTKDVGAIDRNGTTVHLPYLTTNTEVDQRLVLVNRGADDVSFWIENSSFNLEAGTEIMTNNLAPDMAETIPGNGRRVLRTVDQVKFSGQDRGAATVNVAAPTRDIDVMTIQRSPATGEVDTTVYQHAD